MHAGPGYGGSCFPKDTLALVRTAEQAGKPLRIVETVVDVNSKRKQQMAKRVIKACGGTVDGKKICVLGVTFKPNTDDMRDSPSIEIIAGLQKSGAFIYAYDPEGMKEAKLTMTDVNWCKSAYEAIEGADVAVIITEWNEFRGLDMKRVKSLMKTPILVDFRNIYNPIDMADTGIAYSCIGRSL